MPEQILDRDVLAKIGPLALEAAGIDAYRRKAWMYRGIAFKERPKIQRLAERFCVDTPADFLDVQRPYKSKPARKPAPKTKRRAAA